MHYVGISGLAEVTADFRFMAMAMHYPCSYAMKRLRRYPSTVGVVLKTAASPFAAASMTRTQQPFGYIMLGVLIPAELGRQ